MAYRNRYNRYSKPATRNIQVKFSGQCVCCGGTIQAGEMATYYPIGSIAGVTVAKIAHIGGPEGNSAKCTGILKNAIDSGINDYAGDGVDSRYEDDCARICGL